jgi:low affinity Fe/Cu permease
VTDAVQVAAITAAAGIIVTVVTVFGNKMVVKQDKMDKKMDGRLDELLELTRTASKAEGHKQGVEDEQGRDKTL